MDQYIRYKGSVYLKIRILGIFGLRDVIRKIDRSSKITKRFSPNFSTRPHRLTALFGTKSAFCTGIYLLSESMKSFRPIS